MSMRSAASCTQPRQERVVPRGARIASMARGISTSRGAALPVRRAPWYGTGVSDRAFIAALRLLPKNALSRAVGAATRLPLPGPVGRGVMGAFARHYRIDLSECGDLSGFMTFGQFFARPLRTGLRPVAPGEDVLVS